MGYRELLKSNALIRNIGKKVKIYRESINDAKNFSNYYLESAEKKKDYRYSILLIVHSLEKGMCMSNPRPFGADKVKELIKLLTLSSEKECQYEYNMGLAAVFEWVRFYEMHGWENEREFQHAKDFITSKAVPEIKVGSKVFQPTSGIDEQLGEEVLTSRHSVRLFKTDPIKKADIEFALKCFIEAPTACNRQMCKVYQIKEEGLKSLFHKYVIGISGFDKSTVNYFIVTYDLAAFAYSGERSQGLFNAGLCTMNFLNALNIKGIGTCCLQWSNKASEDKLVRTRLKIRESERIAVVIGAGYYLDENVIPCSVRRDINDIFEVR